MKTVAIFIDGTWNRQRAAGSSNVWKMFNMVEQAEDQRTFYVRGVGSIGRKEFLTHAQLRNELEPQERMQLARTAIGGLTGLGTCLRIQLAYEHLCECFERGDKLFIFGFSRGAFAARSLAGFLEKVGLLLKQHADQVRRAWRIYVRDEDPRQHELSKFLYRLTGSGGVVHGDHEAYVKVHFLGVWDTVAALGAGKATDRWTRFHQVDLPSNVMAFRHAVALHENRASFDPILYNASGFTSLRQIWFPGAHADVGGGYLPAEAGLANGALAWMRSEAQAHGLRFSAIPEDSVFGSPPDVVGLGSRASLPNAAGATAVGARVVHSEADAFPFALLAPRARHRSPTFRTLPGAAMHRSVAEHLLDPGRRHYAFTRSVYAALASSDDWALQQLLERRQPEQCSGRDYLTTPWESEAAQGWWRTATMHEVDDTERVIRSFCAGSAVDIVGLARAMALRIVLEPGYATDAVGRVLAWPAEHSDPRTFAERAWVVLALLGHLSRLAPPAVTPGPDEFTWSWIDGPLLRDFWRQGWIRIAKAFLGKHPGVGLDVTAIRWLAISEDTSTQVPLENIVIGNRSRRLV